MRRTAGYSYIKRPPTLNARWPFGHQWHAGLPRQHSPASAVAGISEGMCIPQGECRPIPCRNPCTALRVAPWAGSHRSFRHRHTLRRLPWDIGRPVPRAEALHLCRLRSLAVATPELSAPTSGIATRPLRLHAYSSRCCTTPPKLVVITPLPLAGGAAGALPYAYAYASVSLCRCHALSAAQAIHS